MFPSKESCPAFFLPFFNSPPPTADTSTDTVFATADNSTETGFVTADNSAETGFFTADNSIETGGCIKMRFHQVGVYKKYHSNVAVETQNFASLQPG